MAYSRNFQETISFSWVRTMDGTTVSYPSTKVLSGSRSGERMPDWKEKIRLGLQASTPFTSDRYSFKVRTPGAASLSASFIPGEKSGNPSRTTQTWSGQLYTPPTVLTHLGVSLSKSDAVAKAKMYRKIQRANGTDWRGASAFAEFADVLRQFGAPMSGIMDLVNRQSNKYQLALRNLSGSTSFRRIRYSKVVADTYLETVFGLLPLMSDTEAAAKALGHFHHEIAEGRIPTKTRLVTRGDDVASTPTTVSTGVGSTWLAFNRATTITTHARTQYIAGMRSTLLEEIGSRERLMQLCGFTSRDFIPAAWEALPWSWLYDYFTNIGSILDAASISTEDVAWLCKTNLTETALVSSSTFDGYRSTRDALLAGWRAATVGRSGGEWILTRKTVARSIPQSLGIPPLTFKVPSELGQWANMAAVIVGRQKLNSGLWLGIGKN